MSDGTAFGCRRRSWPTGWTPPANGRPSARRPRPLAGQDLLRKSYYAPVVVKVRTLKAAKDEGPAVRAVDLWFVAHGDWEMLTRRISSNRSPSQGGRQEPGRLEVGRLDRQRDGQAETHRDGQGRLRGAVRLLDVFAVRPRGDQRHAVCGAHQGQGLHLGGGQDRSAVRQGPRLSEPVAAAGCATRRRTSRPGRPIPSPTPAATPRSRGCGSRPARYSSSATWSTRRTTAGSTAPTWSNRRCR